MHDRSAFGFEPCPMSCIEFLLVFADMLEKLQHTTWLKPKSQPVALDTGHGNLLRI